MMGCVAVLLAAGVPAATSGAQQDTAPSADAPPADAPPADAPAADTPLEEGEGRDVVIAKCTSCHDLERVPAKRRDRVGWEDLVDSMRSRGAEMTTEERDTIVEYLNAHYGIPD